MASQAEEDENSQRWFVNPPRGFEKSPCGFEKSPRGFEKSPRGFEKSPRGIKNLKNTIEFIIKQCLHPDCAGVWSENFF
jgi:hypothetical protein